ncbi:hypothetical protein Tco_0946473 [Tanacetum coccineum]
MLDNDSALQVSDQDTPKCSDMLDDGEGGDDEVKVVTVVARCVVLAGGDNGRRCGGCGVGVGDGGEKVVRRQ